MTIPSNWYEDFFYGVSLDLWRKAIPPKQTKSDADFIAAELKCEAGAHLLDAPSGNGRIALELARRGFRVTGVDIAEEFIAEAQAAAAGLTDGTPAPRFILGNMNRIEGEAIYDGAYCFGNSFGFLDYAGMESFLDGVARALRPGARFVVETAMAAESVIPKFEAEASHQIDDILLTIKESYLAAESCIETEYIFQQDGKSDSRQAKHWIYTAGEIRRMLERAGFEVVNTCGSLKGKPYVLGADELFVTARRRS